jgi:hypothetical protein
MRASHLDGSDRCDGAVLSEVIGWKPTSCLCDEACALLGDLTGRFGRLK